MELTKAMALDAKKKGKLIFHFDLGVKYARFKEGFRSIERGTVIIGNRIIFAYPHIKRIFTLKRGIERNIKSDEVYIEEKIDGYNIRITSINGKPIAFSRGGFIDYFITEKLDDFSGIEKFLSKFPNAVLCSEVIGNTPYTKPTSDFEVYKTSKDVSIGHTEFDVKIFVFDIDRGDGEFLPCNERYELLKMYGIESVPLLGRLYEKDSKKINLLALAALKSKKEGIVIKSANRQEAVKFVNPLSDINDIASNVQLFFDMPTGFYMQRVLRSAIFIREFGLDSGQYAKQLGNAFYGLNAALNQVDSGEEIGREHEIVIKNPQTWYRLLKQMSHEVKIEKIFEREENGKIRIRFKKIYRKTTRRLRELLNGKGIED